MRLLAFIGIVLITSVITPRTSLGLSLSASPLSGQKNNKMEFSEQPLAFAQIINADFNDSSFSQNTWFQISIKNTNWLQSRLTGTRISKADLSFVQFISSDLAGVKCAHCLLQDVLFEDCYLDGVHFLASTLKNVRFVRSDLSRADFVSTACVNCSVDLATAKTVTPEQLKKWNFVVKDSP
ncbi:pentapeptide repeat-containing protein [uncultured Bdellovibrio sp.]|uniref:pentapeptide repeat-containing protein n=1 Tax=Bdellovibrio sp. HCB-162 TaxID=3394234 RepID=UPI0025E90893|nr:pentapeptide repeat-containing protein [uncultured Bdellovibrio sp.]